MVLASVSRARIALTNAGMGRLLGLGPVPFSKAPSRSASRAMAAVVMRVGLPPKSRHRCAVPLSIGDASAKSPRLRASAIALISLASSYCISQTSCVCDID